MNFLFSTKFPLFSVKMRGFFKGLLVGSKGSESSMNVLICHYIVLFLVLCPFFIKPLQAQALEVVDEGVFSSTVLWEFGKDNGVQVDGFALKAFDEFKKAVSEVGVFFSEFYSFLADFFVSDVDQPSEKEYQKWEIICGVHINVWIAVIISLWICSLSLDDEEKDKKN